MENPFYTAFKILYLIFFGPYWWIYMPAVAFFVLFYSWYRYIRQRSVAAIKWILLEVRIPPNILKSPKSMEQVFAGLHGIQSTPDFIEKYWKGKVQDWFSCEILSRGGIIHFLIRTPDKFRNLVEAQIFAQYPEAEINEVADYVTSMPNPSNEEWDLWGSELILVKDDLYPIRTYKYFESPDKEKTIDPLASFLEALSKMTINEQIWIQFLIRPILDKWKDAGKKLVEETMSRSESKEGVFFMKVLSPGEREVLEAVENNISKIGFEVVIRFIYSGKKDVYSRSNISAIVGCFKQFNSENLNGFKPNGKISPSIKYIFKNYRNSKRKMKIYKNYIKRHFPFKSGDGHSIYVLNIEELATLYHLPAFIVETPTLSKIQSKKGEPPIGLPIK